MTTIVTLSQAAVETGRSVDSVQSDVRAGCPVVRRGERGRGRGTLLDLEEYRRWLLRRAGIRADLGAVSRALWKLYANPSEGSTVPLWRGLKLQRREALELVLAAFRLTAREISGAPIDDEKLPPEMRMATQYLSDLRFRDLQLSSKREDFKR